MYKIHTDPSWPASPLTSAGGANCSMPALFQVLAYRPSDKKLVLVTNAHIFMDPPGYEPT